MSDFDIFVLYIWNIYIYIILYYIILYHIILYYTILYYIVLYYIYIYYNLWLLRRWIFSRLEPSQSASFWWKKHISDRGWGWAIIGLLNVQKPREIHLSSQCREACGRSFIDQGDLCVGPQQDPCEINALLLAQGPWSAATLGEARNLCIPPKQSRISEVGTFSRYMYIRQN